MHSGDPPLHCNLLTCRRAISALANDRAVVTTCSHVFCEPCATAAFSAALVCPACETPLPEPEDIALTTLNPSERYKSSVLSGLPPSVIHDIAGRALSFWVYQITQECALLELASNQADARANTVTAQSDQELTALRDQLHALEQDRELDRRRVHDLTEQCAEKSRELARLQVQLDHLRRKSIVPTAANGGGSGELIANGDQYPQHGQDAWRVAPAGGQAAVAGAGHGPSAPPPLPTASTWRPWNGPGNVLPGGSASNGYAGNQGHHHQDRSMRQGSVIPNPVAANGAAAAGAILTARSGRSALGPPVMFGPHLQRQMPPPQAPHGLAATAHSPQGHRTAAVEWMQQQVPQQQQHVPMVQQHQQQHQHRQGGHGHVQRRSSRKSSGHSHASR